MEELSEEDPDVQQSIRFMLSSLEDPAAGAHLPPLEQPSAVQSVMESLGLNASISIALPSLQAHKVKSNEELETFLEEEKLLDDLEDEEIAELEGTLQSDNFQRLLNEDMDQLSEAGSPVDQTNSNPDQSLVQLQNRPPLASLAAAEQEGISDQPWCIAHPLTPLDQEVVTAQWHQCFIQTYQQSIQELPKYEQRRLDSEVYLASSKSSQAPNTADLEKAVRVYKSSACVLFPLTCTALQEHSGVIRAQFEQDLATSIKPFALHCGIKPESVSALQLAAHFMAACVPILSTSPYDDECSLPERQQKLIEIREELDTHKKALHAVLETESSNPSANDLCFPIGQDLEALTQTLNEQLEAMDHLIRNDFSQHRNLVKGQQRLLKGALSTVEQQSTETQRALDKAKKSSVKRALRDKLDALGLLKASYAEQLQELAQQGSNDTLVPDIVSRLHDLKSQLKAQLKLARVGSTAIDKGLQTALNTSFWEPVRKHYVMSHHGKFHHFDLENIPAGALHWSAQGLSTASTVEQQTKADCFNLDHCGRSSMSTTEEEHAVNAWVVRMHAGEDKIMSKVRSGVPVPFPLIGRKDVTEDQIRAITVRRLKETIAMMVLEAKGNTLEFREAINDDSKVIPFRAIHTSLLSPDRVRKALNVVAERLPQESRLRKLMKKKLDNEMAMHSYLQQAMAELEQQPLALRFRDENGEEKTVNVQYEGILFSCPINKLGQQKGYNVWKAADPVNERAAQKMFGGTSVDAPLEGIAKEFLDSDAPQKDKILVEKACRQVQYILAKKLHHKHKLTALLLPSLLNLLGQYLADGYHDFCKSGKDRTGLENMHAIMLRALVYVLGDTDIPPLDAPQSADDRFNHQSALFCTGQAEIVQQNIAEAGLKIDQGDEPTGQRYHDIHY